MVEVVNGLKNRNLGNLIERVLINKIQAYIDLDWEIDVQHTFWEENHYVDSLAKNRIEISEDYCFFDSRPPRFRHIFDADLIGIVVPQLDVL